jgi:hypothetical protein
VAAGACRRLRRPSPHLLGLAARLEAMLGRLEDFRQRLLIPFDTAARRKLWRGWAETLTADSIDALSARVIAKHYDLERRLHELRAHGSRRGRRAMSRA